MHATQLYVLAVGQRISADECARRRGRRRHQRASHCRAAQTATRRKRESGCESVDAQTTDSGEGRRRAHRHVVEKGLTAGPPLVRVAEDARVDRGRGALQPKTHGAHRAWCHQSRTRPRLTRPLARRTTQTSRKGASRNVNERKGLRDHRAKPRCGTCPSCPYETSQSVVTQASRCPEAVC
jgi:hypothetical protein